MNKFVKIISTGLIILIFVLSCLVLWKVFDNISQTLRQDLHSSFEESLSKYGKK